MSGVLNLSTKNTKKHEEKQTLTSCSFVAFVDIGNDYQLIHEGHEEARRKTDLNFVFLRVLRGY
jgi:hypothetical protein